MREDQHVLMTLAIADSPSDLQVIGVNGRDRLNAPFCFDVDLVSLNPALPCQTLLHRDAYLQSTVVTGDIQGLHGQIHGVRQLYRGSELSLYRLRLMPGLQRLTSATRRRSLNGLSVPQIIVRLLQDHGFSDDSYRFEQLIGVYPPREHCVQYGESDLHLLHRLCEEEGISLRFEHRPDRHILVFSDDPAGFPEWPTTIQVEHLAEQLSIRTCYSSHAGELYTPQFSMASATGAYASNQPLWALSGADATPGRHQQISGRRLERLRCERREIMGRSGHPWLRAGQVIRVDGHPEPMFNDQWLLTDVEHRAKQLAPLRGCPASDILQILQAMATANPCPAELAHPVAPGGDLEFHGLAHYANVFRVLPWTMPFRPALKHHKPCVTGAQLATQTFDAADKTGRVRIRYDWQANGSAESGEDSWARVVSDAGQHQAGSRLQVRFFEGDPDQPLVVCTLDSDGVTHLTRTVRLNGTAQDCAEPLLSLRANERLRVDSHTPLLLRSARATLSITENGIHYSPLAAADTTIHGLAIHPGDDKRVHDLQLMHPGQPTQPLKQCTWYIVRMPTPDLSHLARISGEDILFEGKTNAQGWLGLTQQEFSKLLHLCEQPENQLCLVHPGHCRTLASCFQHARSEGAPAEAKSVPFQNSDDNART